MWTCCWKYYEKSLGLISVRQVLTHFENSAKFDWKVAETFNGNDTIFAKTEKQSNCNIICSSKSKEYANYSITTPCYNNLNDLTYNIAKNDY